MEKSIVPARFQPPLPLEKLLVKEPAGEKPRAARDDPRALRDDVISLDVVFVGAGPAGLAGAIELKRLVKAAREKGGDVA